MVTVETLGSGGVAQPWSMRNLPELDEEQFRLWQALLEERTGMALAKERKTFLETSLAMRMRELGLAKYDIYYEQRVNRPPADTIMEGSILVDRLTVQETSFFRHMPTFDFIRNYINQRIAAGSLADSFDVWSVGCATGARRCPEPGGPGERGAPGGRLAALALERRTHGRGAASQRRYRRDRPGGARR